MILATLLLAAGQAATGPATRPPSPPTLVARTAPLPPALPWSGASERLVADAGDPWITPAETAGFDTTPDLAETYAWLRRLDAASDLVSIETIGTSPEGREILAVRAGRDDGEDRPVLLVQAGIHGGEIDGKDAGLMLLRDIAFGGKAALLDRATLVFVPVFNVDGHERVSLFSRPNQRGPARQGWRTTAQNLNLNRDYLKADAPEMRAMLALMNRIDPALYLDLHVTDGIDYQYDITYGFNGWGGEDAWSPEIARWMDARLRPALDTALERGGHIPGPLVFAVDNGDPDAGLVAGPSSGRYSNGYGDLRHMPTVLVENHSLKPYRQRVLGTYLLVEAALRMVGEDVGGVRAAIATDRARRPREMAHGFEPDAETRDMAWRGVAWERYTSAASGREEVRWLGRPADGTIAVRGQHFTPARPLPARWWVPPTAPDLVALLERHGVAVERHAAPVAVELETVRLVDPRLATRAVEGRVGLDFAGLERGSRPMTMPAGSVSVAADQPLGLVAAALLEPESPDSHLRQGGFPAILQRTEYAEGYVIAPLADRMLAEDAALRDEFEAKLAADPAFAADGDARLAWFYARTPYYDARFNLYPVARELRR